MDMNISMRDKKILLMFLGVGIFAAGYFFGYRPQMEEAESIQASNAPLQERLNDLLKLADNKDFYLEETDSINAKVDEYTSEFPADIRSEDGIVLSMNMEDSLDMSISNVGLGTREFIAALDGSTEDPLIDMPDETLSEQANAQTQAQVDEIEGTDTQGEKDLQNASDEEVENAAMTLTTPVLYRTQDSMQFTGTYVSLKDMVDYLADQSGRMTLDNVNASFDSSAALRPTSGLAPAPRPFVAFSPIRILCVADDWSRAGLSEFTATNSTSFTPHLTIRLTAFPPPPPTPITFIETTLLSSVSISYLPIFNSPYLYFISVQHLFS